MRILCTAVILGLSFSCFAAPQVQVDLQEATYQEGKLQTTKGGRVSTDQWQLQAKEIAYHKDEGREFLTAKGDVLLHHRGRHFIGKEFSYDLEAQTGEMRNAIIQFEDVFIGGQTVRFIKDQQVEVDRIYATTSDYAPFDWSAHATSAFLNTDTKLELQNVHGRVQNIPALWLPKHSIYLKKKNQPISLFSYSGTFEKERGPLAYCKYHLISSDLFHLFWRLEYGWRRGPGTALESTFATPDNAHTFSTKSYYAYNKFYNNEPTDDYRSRYRFQGLFKGKLQGDILEYSGSYDKMSDKKMRADFPINDTDMATKERTEFRIKARYDPLITTIYAHPRVNAFGGFKQELPSCTLSYKPMSSGQWGLIAENRLKVAYLDYAYAESLANHIDDFRSLRCEAISTFIRPVHVYPLSITPSIQFSGAAYSNTPAAVKAINALIQADCDIRTTLYHNTRNYCINCSPYICISGITQPAHPLNQVYIFSHEDAKHRFMQLCYGATWNIHSRFGPPTVPPFSAHLFGYSYSLEGILSGQIDRLFFQTEYQSPRSTFTTQTVYNPHIQAIQRADCLYQTTISEYTACGIGVRYRSAFDPKKCLYQDFLLDATRDLDELLASPLTEERYTAVIKGQFSPYPLWSMKLQSQVGLRNSDRPFYYESKVELSTLVWNNWKMGISCTHSAKGNAFAYSMDFIPSH